MQFCEYRFTTNNYYCCVYNLNIHDCREKSEMKECCANDYETPAVSITEAQCKDQDTAV